MDSMLLAGANVNAMYQGTCPIHDAVLNHNMKILEDPNLIGLHVFEKEKQFSRF